MTKCKRCWKIDPWVHTCTPITKEDKIERIYEEFNLSYKKSNVYIWDCMFLINKNSVFNDENINKLIKMWKNKRLPIDQEEEAIEIIYNLINK